MYIHSIVLDEFRSDDAVESAPLPADSEVGMDGAIPMEYRLNVACCHHEATAAFSVVFV